MLFRIGALIGFALSLLTLPALAAPPPKKPAAKPVAASKSEPAKSAKPKAAPAQAKAKPVYKLPTGSAASQPSEPPPGVRVDPGPAAAAAQAPAAPKAAAKAAAAKPKTKKVAKKAGKKSRLAAKGGMKDGRASLSPMEKIDQAQLATDHLANVETKSTLDLLVSYKETLREGDLETAGALLRLVVNDTPTRELATTVNDLLGMPLDTQDTEALVDIAGAARADAVVDHAAATSEVEKIASPLGERIHAAHAAIAAAPRTSRLEALAAYKMAVTEGNPEAAAVALSGVVQRPIDQAAVNQANALLGLENIITPGQFAAAN